MKTLLAVGVILGLATPALADPYQANLRSKQMDAHEMRDVRSQVGSSAPQESAASREDAFVAEYKPAASMRR